MKVCLSEIDGKLIPTFWARHEIKPQEELTYSYGPTKPEYWWRKKSEL